MIKIVDFSLLFKVDLTAPNYRQECLETSNTFSESKRTIFGTLMTYGDT